MKSRGATAGILLAAFLPGCFIDIHELVEVDPLRDPLSEGSGPALYDDGESMGGTGGLANQPSRDLPGMGGTFETVPEDLLDDFEDGDVALPLVGGRSANWHSASDGSGTVLQEGLLFPELLAEPRGSSLRALHFAASGHSGWGAAFGVFLKAAQPSAASKYAPYDLSRYAGLLFWGRGEGEVMIQLRTAQTMPVSSGGTCEEGACHAHFHLIVSFDSKWRPISVPFVSLQQPAWGMPTELRTDQVLSIEFQNKTGDTDIDIWVDDVVFF